MGIWLQNGDFRPDTVNDDFDRVVSLVKQIQDIADRSLQFSACLQGATSLSLPVPVSGELMRWKTDLTGLENVAYPTNLLNVESEDITIVDGQLSYSVTKSGLSISGGRIELAKAGGATDGTLLVAGTDYTVTGEQTFDLLQSYPSGILRVSNVITGLSQEKTYINVKDYGAVGNATTIDTSAISSAMDVAVSTGQTLYFPSGTYVVDAKISKDLTSGTLGLNLLGDGDGSTRIECTSVGCFAFTVDLINNINVNGIHFVPVGVDRGTALEILAANVSTNPYPKLRIENCFFGANTNAGSLTNYFTKGIDFGSTTAFAYGSGIIENCFFQGFSDVDPTKMTAIEVRHANDVHINKCYVYNCLYGLYVDGYPPEGIQIQNCFLINVKSGVRAHSSQVSTPYVRVDNTHINYTLIGIDLKNYVQSFIESNLIYTREDSTEATTTDVYLDDCSTFQINKNHFTNTSTLTTDQRGIEFFGGCTLHKVEGNIIRNRDKGIILTEDGATKTDNSEFLYNEFSAMLTADAEYVLSSNIHNANHFKARDIDYRTSATMSGSGTQTLTTGVAATAEFDTLSSNFAPFELTTTATVGELQVADGVESIGLEVGLRIPSVPSTSEVLIVIERDSGGGFSEVASRSYAGNSTGQYHIDTRPLVVAGGDKIRIRVTQDSGSNKTLQNNTARTILNSYVE
jgi:hypothetical protein